jgi:alpha-beta hydrolase superfamily lysophospholipase
MLTWLVWFPLRVVQWALCIVGAVALLLTAMIATPLSPPPELHSISAARGTVDMSTLPSLERFQARDGTWLGFRHYRASGLSAGRAAIVIHGSSGSTANNIHALSWALAQHGVESYALDIRGHGTSGTRGDIAYVGQLEDDLADFVAVVRTTTPSAPLTLIGHSAGGGFALRVAGSPIQSLFESTVLLAPYLGYAAPTNQADSGGWAHADLRRILALAALHRIGITGLDALPVVAFAVPPNSQKALVGAYTERLRSNFGVHRDFRTDLAAATRSVMIFAGADDELMLSDKYAEAVRDVAPKVEVKLLAGINHMGIVGAPTAVNEIADYVASRGTSGGER